MLTIGRALMARPRLLMLDEPSTGLSPKLDVGGPRGDRGHPRPRRGGTARRAERRPGAADVRPRVRHGERQRRPVRTGRRARRGRPRPCRILGAVGDEPDRGARGDAWPWAPGRPGCGGTRWTTPVRERLALVLLDSLGVTAVGSRLPEQRALVEAWRPGAGPAPLVGSGRTTGVEAAAWLNATAMVRLELDEGNKFAAGHPAAHGLWGVLSLAADLDRSGADTAAALLVAYEVAARFGRATRLRPGSHPHGSWGVAGAAAGLCPAARPRRGGHRGRDRHGSRYAGRRALHLGTRRQRGAQRLDGSQQPLGAGRGPAGCGRRGAVHRHRGVLPRRPAGDVRPGRAVRRPRATGGTSRAGTSSGTPPAPSPIRSPT